jgi:hypothetical protein
VKKTIALVLVAALLFVTGCMTHTHVVGEGGKGQIEVARQWYVLFGLVQMNKVDTKEMAKGAVNYTIKTETTPVDFLISIFTGLVSINCRTVEVSK